MIITVAMIIMMVILMIMMTKNYQMIYKYKGFWVKIDQFQGLFHGKRNYQKFGMVTPSPSPSPVFGQRKYFFLFGRSSLSHYLLISFHAQQSDRL